MPSINAAQRTKPATPSKSAARSGSAAKAGSSQSRKPKAAAKSLPVAEFQRKIIAFLSPGGGQEKAGAIRELRKAKSQLPQQDLRVFARRLVQLAEVLEVKSDAGKKTAPHPRSRRAGKVSNDEFLTQFNAEADASQQKLIAQEKLLNTAEMEQRLHISKQAISKAVSSKRMFAIVGPRGDLYYPAFYADARYDRRVLEKVSKALGDVPAGGKYHFFTSRKASLGNQSPLEALAAGHVQQVLAAAAGYAGR